MMLYLCFSANGFGFKYLKFHSWLFVLAFSTYLACLLCNFQMRILQMAGGLLNLGLFFFFLVIWIWDTLLIFNFSCIWTNELPGCFVDNILRNTFPLHDDLRGRECLCVCVCTCFLIALQKLSLHIWTQYWHWYIYLIYHE